MSNFVDEMLNSTASQEDPKLLLNKFDEWKGAIIEERTHFYKNRFCTDKLKKELRKNFRMLIEFPILDNIFDLSIQANNPEKNEQLKKKGFLRANISCPKCCSIMSEKSACIWMNEKNPQSTVKLTHSSIISFFDDYLFTVCDYFLARKIDAFGFSAHIDVIPDSKYKHQNVVHLVKHLYNETACCVNRHSNEIRKQHKLISENKRKFRRIQYSPNNVSQTGFQEEVKRLKASLLQKTNKKNNSTSDSSENEFTEKIDTASQLINLADSEDSSSLESILPTPKTKKSNQIDSISTMFSGKMIKLFPLNPNLIKLEKETENKLIESLQRFDVKFMAEEDEIFNMNYYILLPSKFDFLIFSSVNDCICRYFKTIL
jgi:hypothetical protein